MKIVTSEVDLRVVEPREEDKETLCEVFIAKKKTGIFIRGKVIEQVIYIS